jgi:hypothetical protein
MKIDMQLPQFASVVNAQIGVFVLTVVLFSITWC